MTNQHWNEHEIKRAARIIAKTPKSAMIRILDDAIHWMVILIAILGNAALGAFLILLSNIVVPWAFYSLVVFSGLLFGILVEVPLYEIRKLDHSKHFLSRAMLVLCVIVNVYLLYGISEILILYVGSEHAINVLLTGFLYGIAFLIPFFYSLMKK